MITKDQAATILAILDTLGMAQLTNVVEQHGIPATDIIGAWKSLEELAGMSHTAPDLGDFD